MSNENNDKIQLKDFLKVISKDYNKDELKVIEHIIDVDKRQSFTKKMIILQWYFYEGIDDFSDDAKMFRNALRESEENGLIRRFNIANSKIGFFVKHFESDDRTGEKSARTEINKMIKDKIIFKKDWKNKRLTKIGKLCAKFLYFKLLEEKISVNGIWQLINIKLEEKNLSFIETDLSIKDLINWFIIKECKGGYCFTDKFLELIEFLKDHPELYPKEFKIITDTLLSRLKNTLIHNLDKLEARLTKSGNKIYFYKDNLKDIDWIYKIDCTLEQRKFNLFEWVNNFEKEYIKDPFDFFNKLDDKKIDKKIQLNQNLLVLQAPAGYGKTILLYQLVLNFFDRTNNKIDFRIIPMFFSLKNFEIRDDILYYNNSKLVDLEEFNRHISNNKGLKFIYNILLKGILSVYKYNENTINFFISVLNKCPILLILDGWDEAPKELKQIIKNLLVFILENQFELKLKDSGFSKGDWIKIIISTRYIENSIISIFKHFLGEEIKKENYILNLKLPEKEVAFNYLQIVSDKFNSKKDFERLVERFHHLTPLDLYILGIFPKMEIPKYKSQMYERWIYYQVLLEYLEPEDIKSIKSDEDIRSYLEKIKIKRDSDNKEFFLIQYIDGYLFGNDQINYSLFEILPQIVYSSKKPKSLKPIRYFDAVINNPILKRFIRPYYKGLQNYAILLDPHFLEYFLAKYIYNQFLKDSPVEPIPNMKIENFLQEFFLRDVDNPKIKKLGILNEKDFPNYLYLQSNIILPSLRIPYNYGDISIPLNWESLEYGNYIMKGFQFEFQKAIKNNDLEKKYRILDLFQEYKVNRPTKVWGSFLDEFSKEFEIGEPQVNHDPLEYFTLITKLLNIEGFEMKSREEIRYLGLEKDFLMNFQLYLKGSSNQFYYKKEDIPKIINQIFESDNIYLIPWLAKIYNLFKGIKEYQVNLNEELIIKKYESTPDKFIKNSLLKILIDENPNRALKESDRFLKNNDKGQFNQLIDVLINKIEEKEKISKDLFALWIKYYKNPNIILRQKYEMVKILFDKELDHRQIFILSSIYRNENFDFNNELKDEKYLNPEKNPKELGFMFNCLLFLNYRNQNKSLNDKEYVYLREYNLLFDYALKTRKYFYFTLINESQVFSDEIIKRNLSRCGFELLFSFSENIFRNLPYIDRPYYKKFGEFLSDTYNYLLDFQKTWWDKRKPKTYYDLERYLRKVFDFFKEHNDTWDTITLLEDSYIIHEYNDRPEIIQLNAIFNVIDHDFPDVKENLAIYFFNLVSEYFLNENAQIDNIYNNGFISDENFIHLPKFVIYTFEKFCDDINPEIRLEWIDKLITKKVNFKDFKILFKNIKDFKHLYDKIWMIYGDHWIRNRWYSRRRPDYGIYFDRNGKDNKDELRNIIHLLPFEFINQKLRETLNWEELQNNYDREVYKKYVEGLIETDKVKEKSNEFLSALEIYSYKLSELSLFLEDSEKPLLILRDLWERYFIYPLVPQEIHPSYKIFWNLTFELPKKLYDLLNNEVAKIFLILCQFGRFFYSYTSYADKYNLLLKELSNFHKKEIEKALMLIAKTDWSFKHKFILLLFSNFSPKIIPIIREFMDICREELDWEIESKIRSIIREKGVYKGEQLNLPKKKFRFEDIFEYEQMFEINILRNYSLLLRLITCEFPNDLYLEELLENYSNDNYEKVLKELKKLKPSKYASLIYLLDERKLIEFQEFNKLKGLYMEKIRNYKEKMKKNEFSYFRDSKIFNILNYFRKSKEVMDKITYDDQSSIEDIQDLDFSDIKDHEFQDIIDDIKNETIKPDEIINFFKSEGLRNDILNLFIPSQYDNSDDFYDFYDEKVPNLSRKYQKHIFWFLIYLLYNKTEYKHILQKSENVNKNRDFYENICYVDDLKNLIKALIFDGIQHNNLLEWYNNCPKDIPSEWIKKNLDPIIIQEVFLPNQIEFVPTHLRDKARRHAWKYIIIPDLANKIKSYYESYRNIFPEINKNNDF
ncbi:MAG: hypothetical protein ACP6IY_19265 [Promethearchaeia archaeon]